MISDYFILAMRNLRKRKLRSWLTMLGIFISIATIFILISLSLGLRGAVNEQFRMLGTDKFFIMPLGQIAAPGSGGAVEMTTGDIEVIEKVNGVKFVSYMLMGNAKVEYNKKIRYFYAIGIPLDDSDKIKVLYESASLKLDEGKFLGKGDTGEVMMGYDYKYSNVFGKPITAGDKVIINEKEFKVKAILARIGNPSDDKNIYLSVDDFKELYNSGDRVDYIIVQIDDSADIKEVAERVKKKLLSFRGLKEENIDFTILTPEELLKSFDMILNIVTAFLIGVAAISLIVGGIGIANTMYTSVLERTREIGVMKSIGAKNSDVLLIFLIESGLLGLVGGIIGVLLGAAIAKMVEYIAINYIGTTLLAAAIPLSLVFGCLAFAFFAGIIFGGWPAWNASKIKPTDALRYE